MRLLYNQIYRGYQWQITPTYIYAMGRLRNTTFRFGNFIQYAQLERENLAQEVHRQRRISIPTMIAYDHVPWEIHEILDEDAYEAALAAFKAAQRYDL